MRLRYFRCFLLVFLCIVPAASHAGGLFQGDTLKVGYVGSEPFVIDKEGANPEGIVFDIWKEIAFSLDRQYELQAMPSIDKGISAVNSGEVDLLIGPVTINSDRAAKISFTQPFFDTELAILAPVREPSLWDFLKLFFSPTFLIAILGLLLTLGFVGFLFWLVEARYFPEEYPKKPIECIGIGAWLAVVTMTTVGYGDYAPKTPRGRVLMAAWMIVSLIMATSFVAGIATTFSKFGSSDLTITSLKQVDGKRVAVPSNQRVVSLVRAVDGNSVEVDDVGEAYSLLLDGKVDVVLYDEVPLEYIFQPVEKEAYKLTKKQIYPQHYGFVLPKNSDLLESIDRQIILMRETKEIDKIVSEWIGN